MVDRVDTIKAELAEFLNAAGRVSPATGQSEPLEMLVTRSDVAGQQVGTAAWFVPWKPIASLGRWITARCFAFVRLTVSCHPQKMPL